jgi:hypothetical protein
MRYSTLYKNKTQRNINKEKLNFRVPMNFSFNNICTCRLLEIFQAKYLCIVKGKMPQLGETNTYWKTEIRISSLSLNCRGVSTLEMPQGCCLCQTWNR